LQAADLRHDQIRYHAAARLGRHVRQQIIDRRVGCDLKAAPTQQPRRHRKELGVVIDKVHRR
jgi:hypothetical protein